MFDTRKTEKYTISIHAPRTGSDKMVVKLDVQSTISIHAPRTGSDNQHGHKGHNRRPISIHAPRTGSDTYKCPDCGATVISIHAPRTGSDHARRMEDYMIYKFQSTLPARGATGGGGKSRCDHRDFNPRSPHGERRERVDVANVPNQISIHAPRTGSDARHAQEDTMPEKHFNPRSPHGERPHSSSAVASRRHFNPRSPHGERHHQQLHI